GARLGIHGRSYERRLAGRSLRRHGLQRAIRGRTVMVSHLVRLRYLLMWNGFRRSVGTMIGAIFSALGFLYFIVMAYILAFVAAFSPIEAVSYTDRGAVLVLCGGVTLIVWIVGPIVFSS